MTQPKISIGIPFTIWNNLVEESLDHCLRLNYPNFSITLVPNEGVIIPDKYHNDARILIRPTQKTGIAHKRNTALHSCEADFHACIDSDAYPKTDWLQNALQGFTKSPNIWAVGGPNISPDYTSLKKQAVANALRSAFVAGPRVFCKRLSSEDQYVNDLQTCNLIFSKEAIAVTKGFNENFVTAEDSNLCERIRQAGKKIYFSKDVIVYHHNRSLFTHFIKQKIVFGYAVIPFIKNNLHPKLLFHFLPLSFVIFAALGWAVIFLYKPLFILWLIIMILYLSIAAVESYRWSKKTKEIPLTFLALIIGNIGPGLGTLAYLLKIKFNFATFYTNYDTKKFKS